MTTKLWPQIKRALAASGNLTAGAGALALSAITWNPLPVILYGLGEPVWLYRATRSGRYAAELREDQHRSSLAFLESQLHALMHETPCGTWMTRGALPDYPRSYARLVEIRDQTARIVAARDDDTRRLEDDILLRMADMLRAYLLMVRERLLFHCALAKVYPRLPEPARHRTVLARIKHALVAPPAREIVPWREDTRFVAIDAARHEVRTKVDRFRADIQRSPEHAEVYQPIVETLEKRLEELDHRARNDLDMRAQLDVFPDQFELILGKLATTRTDVGEVVTDMKLLLEQTDDTVSFAEDMRTAETYTLGRLSSLGQAA